MFKDGGKEIEFIASLVVGSVSLSFSALYSPPYGTHSLKIASLMSQDGF